MALAGKKYFYARGFSQGTIALHHVPRYPKEWGNWPEWAKRSFSKGFRDGYNYDT